MNRYKAVWQYIKYYFTAKTKHGVHPPFAFNLLTKVILDKRFKKEYVLPETIRKEMLNSRIAIKICDLGAGSLINSGKIKQVKSIAKRSLKSPKYAQLIYRLVAHFKPSSIIELGTSLGITTVYLSQAIPNGKIITIEGCEETASIARQNFSNRQISQIEVINKNFDEALPEILRQLTKVGMVFFDGNHRKVPTLQYFELCKQYAQNDSVFIFDDIHWSPEMEEAWKYIQQDKQITLSLDLHFLGIVFFRKELSKQNFVLRF